MMLNKLGNQTVCWPRLLSQLLSDTFQLHTLVCEVGEIDSVLDQEGCRWKVLWLILISFCNILV